MPMQPDWLGRSLSSSIKRLSAPIPIAFKPPWMTKLDLAEAQDKVNLAALHRVFGGSGKFDVRKPDFKR